MQTELLVAHLTQQAGDLFQANLTISVAQRSQLLRAWSKALATDKERLVALADTETHLGPVRLNSEVNRTCFQLEALADYIEQGKHLRFVSEPGFGGAPPLGRPQLDLSMVPVGPVAVFSASNFPFAFSVLGGDTASALAAGCPVVVKAHPAHPLLSREVFGLAQQVLAQLGMPAAWLAMLDAPGYAQGRQLVMQPEIAAVSFTGSLSGGKALAQLISQRDKPIAFFGELGSINPVLVMPGYLAHNDSESAHVLADSIVQGAGQFCTSPGLVVADESAAGDAFVQALASRLDAHRPHAMLTPAMQTNFDALVRQSLAIDGVRKLTTDVPSKDSTGPTPTLVEVSLAEFLCQPALRDEIFGPYAVVVRVPGTRAAYETVLTMLEGSLTLSFWAHASDAAYVSALLPLAKQRAGRVLFAGVPTGVAVAEAQHHGGPWPASTRPDSTSVGMRSIERFLRPVALQDRPAWLIFDR
jgi:NADP-dependent aldehyde dehydrogenase